MLAAVLALTAAGCSAGGDAQPDDAGAPALLSLQTTIATPADGAAAMRAATGLQPVQIAAGQQVSVVFSGGTVVSSGSATAVGQATATADGSGGLAFTAPAAALYLAPGEVTVWADVMHPAAKTSAAMTAFTVERDQSSSAGYLQSDLLYGNAVVTRRTGDYTRATAAVTLSHKLSKLTVTATADGTLVKQVQAVRLVSGYRTVGIDNAYGCRLGTALADAVTPLPAGWLTLYSGGTAATATASCLVPPQTLRAGELVRVETDRGAVTFRVDSEFTLSEGCSYAVTLPVITQDQIEHTGNIEPEVIPWTDTTPTNIDIENR